MPIRRECNHLDSGERYSRLQGTPGYLNAAKAKPNKADLTDANMTLPFMNCAAVTAISAIVSLGYSIAALRSASGEARTLALYTSAQSLALVVVSIAAFLVGAVAWLEAAACCMIIVQACDAAIGVTIRDRLKTFGPAATALLNLAALVWLLS